MMLGHLTGCLHQTADCPTATCRHMMLGHLAECQKVSRRALTLDYLAGWLTRRRHAR